MNYYTEDGEKLEFLKKLSICEALVQGIDCTEVENNSDGDMLNYLSEGSIDNLIYTVNQIEAEEGIKFATKFIERFEKIKDAVIYKELHE